MLSEQPDQSDNNDQQGSFATIQIRPGFARPDISLFAEVKGIRIYQPVSASYLKELAYE
jgi:hypothetical protein